MPGLVHPFPGANQWGDVFGTYVVSDNVHHPGLDLNVGAGDDDLGMPVYSLMDGVVDGLVPWDGVTYGFGNHVRVRHQLADGSPFWSHAAHLNEFSPGLSNGQSVDAGYILGTCGRSGNQQWSHVHYQLEKIDLALTYWPLGVSLEKMQSLYMDPRTILYFALTGGFPQDATPPTSPTLTQAQIDILALSEALGKTAEQWDELFNVEKALQQQKTDLVAEVRGLRADLNQVKALSRPSLVVLRYPDDSEQQLEVPA